MTQNNLHVLLFTLQKELFGISVMNVIRVTNIEKLIRIPKAPTFIAGAINFEGNVIPVVDLASKIELGTTTASLGTKVIILEVDHDGDSLEVGIMIDEVLDVAQVEAASLLPPPLDNMGFNTSALTGMHKIEDDFYMILSARKIFEKELASLVR